MSLEDWAFSSNTSWCERGLERTERVISGSQSPHTVVDGRETLLAGSSDYLGLGANRALADAAHKATLRAGVGSGGSRLTTGTSDYHVALERDLAGFVGAPAALVFGSGYHANMGVIPALAAAARDCGERLSIFSDADNHASIIDGIRLAKSSYQGVRSSVYPHLDVKTLEEQLAADASERRLIVSDGVFSMSGELANLHALQELAQDSNAWLMIDDAHGIGTLGKNGRGVCEHFDLPLSDIYIGTASKALGVAGAFVAGSEPLIKLCRQRCRSYIFSTSMPPSQAATISAALALVPSRVQRLARVVRNLRQRLRANGWKVVDSPAPIIVLPVGAEGAAMECAAQAAERGVIVSPIRYPSVPLGQALLRLTAHADYSEEDIALIVDAVGPCLNSATAVLTTK